MNDSRGRARARLSCRCSFLPGAQGMKELGGVIAKFTEAPAVPEGAP
jgi:hypothetical protein